jgi:alkylation response protein AidB-like acyl-CoA dehydrogenase
MPYFDMNLDLTWEDKELRNAVHKFAKEVMRPIAKEVDRMTAQDAVSEGSPFWEFQRKAFALGYHKALFPTDTGGLGFTALQGQILFEEMGWGSFGLCAHVLLTAWVFSKVLASGDQTLIDEFVVPFCKSNKPDMTACWACTEPDKGSDYINTTQDFYRVPGIRCNVQARLDGNEWVLNGQKASWTSGAPVATHCMLNVQIDPSKGLAGGGVCILPLNLPGITRGKPLEKVGQRDLPQGELFFADVRIPKRYMFVGPDQLSTWMAHCLAFGNSSMPLITLGTARAAFDEALAYVKEREQGGKPLIDHYLTKIRIARMFAKLEGSRAMVRAVFTMNMSLTSPLPEYAYAAKAFLTELHQEVVHEALQLHGANGLTKEYPIEKFWRDARAFSIEDGDNDTLYSMSGSFLKDTYPRQQDSVKKIF